jgi:hypothetical protein
MRPLQSKSHSLITPLFREVYPAMLAACDLELGNTLWVFMLFSIPLVPRLHIYATPYRTRGSHTYNRSARYDATRPLGDAVPVAKHKQHARPQTASPERPPSEVSRIY